MAHTDDQHVEFAASDLEHDAVGAHAGSSQAVELLLEHRAHVGVRHQSIDLLDAQTAGIVVLETAQ